MELGAGASGDGGAMFYQGHSLGRVLAFGHCNDGLEGVNDNGEFVCGELHPGIINGQLWLSRRSMCTSSPARYFQSCGAPRRAIESNTSI